VRLGAGEPALIDTAAHAALDGDVQRPLKRGIETMRAYRLHETDRTFHEEGEAQGDARAEAA